MKRLILLFLVLFCLSFTSQISHAATVITPVDSVANVSTSAITLNGSGFPVIAYHYQGMGMRVAVCGNATCTAGNSIATPDAGNVGWNPSLVLNGSGFPVVAHHDDFNFD